MKQIKQMKGRNLRAGVFVVAALLMIVSALALAASAQRAQSGLGQITGRQVGGGGGVNTTAEGFLTDRYEIIWAMDALPIGEEIFVIQYRQQGTQNWRPITPTWKGRLLPSRQELFDKKVNFSITRDIKGDPNGVSLNVTPAAFIKSAGTYEIRVLVTNDPNNPSDQFEIESVPYAVLTLKEAPTLVSSIQTISVKKFPRGKA